MMDVDLQEFLTDVKESYRLIMQADQRLRSAVHIAQQRPIEDFRLVAVQGLGVKIREVLKALETAGKNA